MNTLSTIAGNALQAFGTSQQVTANNLANLNTDGFNASRLSFQENVNGGVKASVSATRDRVDISREATNLISHAQGFTTNLKVLQAADEMTKELLSIKA